MLSKSESSPPPPPLTPPTTAPRALTMCEGQHYARLLFPVGHGYPLWLPAPNAALPAAYSDEGIRIGDVGIITPDGGFDFLFNISLPADHPINQCRGIPNNFTPLVWNGQTFDVPDRFRPGVPVCSRHAKQTQVSVEGSAVVPGSPVGFGAGIEVSFAKDSGAVLMPSNGASRVDCSHRAAFRAYARKHAFDWYQFVNGELGREAENGSLYLVTGFDKSDAWETALFNSSYSSQSCSLIFNTGGIADGKMKLSQSSLHQSSVSSRCSASNAKMNQALFIRGFRVSLRQGPYAWLGRGPKIASTHDSPMRDFFDSAGRFSYSGSYPGSPPSGSRSGSSNGSGRSNGSSSGSTTDSDSELDDCGSEWDSDSCSDDTSIVDGDFDFVASRAYHPLNAVNEYILHANPDVDVVVTHDDDWIALLNNEDVDMPSDQTLIRRFKEKYRVSADNGFAVLNLYQAASLNDFHDLEAPPPADIEHRTTSPTNAAEEDIGVELDDNYSDANLLESSDLFSRRTPEEPSWTSHSPSSSPRHAPLKITMPPLGHVPFLATPDFDPGPANNAKNPSSRCMDTRDGHTHVDDSEFKWIGTSAYWLPSLNSEEDLINTLSDLALSPTTSIFPHPNPSSTFLPLDPVSFITNFPPLLEPPLDHNDPCIHPRTPEVRPNLSNDDCSWAFQQDFQAQKRKRSACRELEDHCESFRGFNINLHELLVRSDSYGELSTVGSRSRPRVSSQAVANASSSRHHRTEPPKWKQNASSTARDHLPNHITLNLPTKTLRIHTPHRPLAVGDILDVPQGSVGDDITVELETNLPRDAPGNVSSEPRSCSTTVARHPVSARVNWGEAGSRPSFATRLTLANGHGARDEQENRTNRWKFKDYDYSTATIYPHNVPETGTGPVVQTYTTKNDRQSEGAGSHAKNEMKQEQVESHSMNNGKYRWVDEMQPADMDAKHKNKTRFRN
ncbi:hypothetical protein Moror_10264 [Moniliophthora roreri MCA 2997]|uniref:Uncharacterized protein n=2 Tax=Moniliophthora roreri TaxID=221103 RepID=V2XEE5_MONRO|nr:hypothetical protein Moror_10264 [Moniliophthora roreri MCA 2997]KAI3604841.1 hypothetical protein WG66_008756 [Moniliophthora roreri]